MNPEIIEAAKAKLAELKSAEPAIWAKYCAVKDEVEKESAPLRARESEASTEWCNINSQINALKALIGES